ncbi:hypothetical protein ACFS5M_10605 [Lacinutrix iliipiscaria]|uniref:Uncharacterized protein n=1 Tax=Lacinutrix iliipiscaria TaxID=1230532 RepID=A0ABW5WNT5_9FLAO
MKWYKNFVVFWTLLYLVFAFVGRFTTSNKEIFPFFRWSLYSKTPNTLNFPYVMVTKIKDSILQPPINILELHNVHHISTVDMNLNVKAFYYDMLKCKDNNETYQGDFFKILPNDSEFNLYEKTIDLREKDYKSTEAIVKILSVKNNTTHFER